MGLIKGIALYYILSSGKILRVMPVFLLLTQEITFLMANEVLLTQEITDNRGKENSKILRVEM